MTVRTDGGWCSQLAVSVDVGLLINPPHAFNRADVIGVLRTQIAWMFGFDFTMRLFLFASTFEGIVKLTSAKRKIPNFMLTPHTLNGFWAMVRHESKLRFSKVRYTVAVVLCLPIWK